MRFTLGSVFIWGRNGVGQLGEIQDVTVRVAGRLLPWELRHPLLEEQETVARVYAGANRTALWTSRGDAITFGKGLDDAGERRENV